MSGKIMGAVWRVKRFKLPWFKSLVVYAVGGGISTLIHYGCACVLYYGFHGLPLVVNAVAFFIASVFSFTWHRRLTFKSSVALRRGYVKFLIIGLIGLGFSQLMMWLSYHTWHLPFWLAQLLALVIIPPITFSLNRFWTFKI